MSISRRKMIASASAIVPMAAAFGQQAATDRPSGRQKVLVAGGHPGDPECGCGGTIARYSGLGHEVVLLYMNRGEGFCRGADPSQCGAVRSIEAQKACQILKARP